MNTHMTSSHWTREHTGQQIALHDSLTDIDRKQWDTLLIPSFYLSYDWLLTMSTTVSPLPQFLTLQLMPGEQLRAGFPVHTITPDSAALYDPIRVLLNGQSISRVCTELTEVDAECCKSLAAEINQSREKLYPVFTSIAPGFTTGLCYAPTMKQAEAISSACEMIQAMESAAQASGALAVSFLYVPETTDSVLHNAALKCGYFRTVVSAECYLPIKWQNFDEYLQSRVKTRRTSIKAEISRFKTRGFHIDVCGVESLNDELVPLHATWRRKYGSTVSEDSLKAQYAVIRQNLGPAVRLFIAREGQKVVGFALFYEYNGVYYSRAIGFDYESLQDNFCYFNVLFYKPIEEAINAGIQSIHYSMESYDAKLGRGCQLRLLLAYIRPLTTGNTGLAQFMQLFDTGQRAYFQHVVDRHPEKPRVI